MSTLLTWKMVFFRNRFKKSMWQVLGLCAQVLTSSCHKLPVCWCRSLHYSLLPTWDIVYISGQVEMHRPMTWWALLLVSILLQTSFGSKSFKAVWAIAASWVTEHSSLETVSFHEAFFSLPQRRGRNCWVSKLHVYCSGNNVFSGNYCVLTWYIGKQLYIFNKIVLPF